MGVLSKTLSDGKRDIAAIAVSSACLLLSLFGPWHPLVFVPTILCGIPIVLGAVIGLVRERDITADLLVSVAIVASIAIGEYEAAAEISIIMNIGSFLESATVDHANRCLTSLMVMKPVTAHVVTDTGVKDTDVERLSPGMTVRILPGERVPADGNVVSGTSSMDTSVITGEHIPRDVSPGDPVCSGTVNLHGTVDVLVERTPEDSTVSRMERLIREADAGRSKVVRTADRWARYIVVMSFLFSVIVYVLTEDAVRAVTVLVVFCPCALVLATPTAIMAAVANLSRRGILVRDGGALERLAGIDTVLTDKTGTLTTGELECIDFVSLSGYSPEELTLLVSAAESLSEHPIGRSIASFFPSPFEPSDFVCEPGRGISATVDGKRVCAGNRQFIRENCPLGFEALEDAVSERESQGLLCTLVGIDGVSCGYATLSDTIRPTSEYAMRHLRMLRIRRIMITGDSRAQAVRVSDMLGLDDVVWECLPSDKLRVVSAIDGDGRCCMIGDGINDAPSLRRASVGISICGMGNELAVESSDMVLVSDDLSRIPGAFLMAKRTLATIRAGIAFSMVVNLSGAILAALGLLGPVGGALVHNIGSVMVIASAAMLLRYDPWRPGRHRPSGVRPDGRTSDAGALNRGPYKARNARSDHSLPDFPVSRRSISADWTNVQMRMHTIANGSNTAKGCATHIIPLAISITAANAVRTFFPMT